MNINEQDMSKKMIIYSLEQSRNFLIKLRENSLRKLEYIEKHLKEAREGKKKAVEIQKELDKELNELIIEDNKNQAEFNTRLHLGLNNLLNNSLRDTFGDKPKDFE